MLEIAARDCPPTPSVAPTRTNPTCHGPYTAAREFIVKIAVAVNPGANWVEFLIVSLVKVLLKEFDL